MAYLNEDGLETLVGKIKGQVIELTSAEYRQLPATKNSDNKLYFVNDEAYAYQIDDEPTSGSSGLVKSGGVYNWTSKIGSGTLTTTAQTLIPAVNEVNAKISELNDSLTFNTANVTSGYPHTIHHCYEHAGIVHLNFRVQFPIQATYTWLTVAYLPQGYTEVATEVYMPVAILLGASSIITTLGAIRNGGVEVFNSTELVASRGSYANAIAYYDTSYEVTK